jgi:hypothetical protein
LTGGKAATGGASAGGSGSASGGTATGGAGGLAACRALCQRTVGRCPVDITQSDCELAVCSIVAPAGCYDALDGATCAEVSSGGTWIPVCYSACSAVAAYCGSGTLTKCTDLLGQLRVATYNCSDLCVLQGTTYSGSCGTSYGSQVSSTGLSVCWCT